jgi:hypothetical protein
LPEIIVKEMEFSYIWIYTMKAIAKYGCLLVVMQSLLGVYAAAQTGISGNGDSLKIPVSKVHVFSNPAPTPAPEPLADPFAPVAKWILKCNPLILIRGQVPVYMEHKLSSKFSVEGAAGFTLEDYGKEALVQGKTLFQKASNVQQLSGPCAKVALRYYPRGTALSEVYFSPEFDFTDYRKDVTGVYMNSGGRYANGILRDQQDYFDLRLILGFQNTDNYDSDFYFDWYIGAGIRAGSENNVSPEEGNPNAILVKHADVITPTVSVGVKIGLGL